MSVLEEPRVFEALKDLLPTESQVLRRFAARADKELKVRLIGLGDYMSQTVLKRPNKEAFSWLASLPQDMTFSQDSSAEIIKSWTGRFHCFDLTSATDRFPIRFIRYPVAAAYGEEYASAWVTVTTGLPFTYVTRAGVVSEASYAVGNPLGFLSSWAYFTWGGHHFVMFLCLLEQL